jgi:protein-arginine kinase activator protein McsA
MKRPLCSRCHGNPAAVNYQKNNKTYYRKICASCSRKTTRNKEMPGWVKTGYKKKLTCERCNFAAKIPQQIFVFYIDGNLKNNNWINLRSVCANCRIDLNQAKTTWRESPLLPDF